MYIDDRITRGFVNFDEVNFGDEKILMNEELDILFEVLLPKIAQIEREAKYRTS